MCMWLCHVCISVFVYEWCRWIVVWVIYVYVVVCHVCICVFVYDWCRWMVVRVWVFVSTAAQAIIATSPFLSQICDDVRYVLNVLCCADTVFFRTWIVNKYVMCVYKYVLCMWLCDCVIVCMWLCVMCYVFVCHLYLWIIVWVIYVWCGYVSCMCVCMNGVAG